MIEPGLQRVIAEIVRYYGDRLVGAALFGSRATPRSRTDSDWDLLLVLDGGEPIRRDLYREWDERVAAVIEALLPAISPHFVHLPAEGDEPSSLWLEVAMAHRILSDPGGRLSEHLRRVRALVEAGRYERRAVHGLRYWRKTG